ncbi:MAG: hypothetical protein ACLRPZ_14100 [Coprococcus sp.]
MKLWKKLCITFLVALMAFFSVNVGNVDAKETVTTKKVCYQLMQEESISQKIN